MDVFFFMWQVTGGIADPASHLLSVCYWVLLILPTIDSFIMKRQKTIQIPLLALMAVLFWNLLYQR